MSVYMTEEEQLESIKKWWGKYGNVVTICLSIVLFSIAGFKYMAFQKAKTTQEASAIYEKMAFEYSNHENTAILSYANLLTKEYSGSVYADAANLMLAKLHVSNDELGLAKDVLQKVAAHSKMDALKQVAKIRLARLMIADKAYDEALKELSVVADNAYLPLVNELRGDIHSAKGQYQEAIDAYKLALDEVKANGMTNVFLEMKTNELASKGEVKGMAENKIQTA